MFKVGDKARIVKPNAPHQMNLIVIVDKVYKNESNELAIQWHTEDGTYSGNLFAWRFISTEKTGLAKFIELQESMV